MSTTQTVQLYETLRKAIAVKGAVVALYRTNGTDEKARVILPRTLHTTKDGADVVYGWDSMRGSEVSFRVDRFASAHLLPMPDVAYVPVDGRYAVGTLQTVGARW